MLSLANSILDDNTYDTALSRACALLLAASAALGSEAWCSRLQRSLAAEVAASAREGRDADRRGVLCLALGWLQRLRGGLTMQVRGVKGKGAAVDCLQSTLPSLPRLCPWLPAAHPALNPPLPALLFCCSTTAYLCLNPLTQSALPSTTEALSLAASRPSRSGPPAALWALHALALVASYAGPAYMPHVKKTLRLCQELLVRAGWCGGGVGHCMKWYRGRGMRRTGRERGWFALLCGCRLHAPCHQHAEAAP